MNIPSFHTDFTKEKVSSNSDYINRNLELFSGKFDNREYLDFYYNFDADCDFKIQLTESSEVSEHQISDSIELLFADILVEVLRVFEEIEKSASKVLISLQNECFKIEEKNKYKDFDIRAIKIVKLHFIDWEFPKVLVELSIKIDTDLFENFSQIFKGNCNFFTRFHYHLVDDKVRIGKSYSERFQIIGARIKQTY